MKPILYWTFTAQWGFYNLKLIGVTSEGPRGRVNGRFEDDAPTHTVKHRCHGRFETKEAAIAIKDQLQEIRKKYKELREPIEKQLQDLHADERKQIEELTK
jgi:hypothetical protein